MNHDSDDISVIAIDLNDTLVRFDIDLFSTQAAVYLSSGAFEVKPSEFYSIYRERYIEYSMGNYQSDDEFFTVLLAEFPKVRVDAARRYIRELLLTASAPFPESQSFLAAISQKYHVVLASNYVADWATDLLRHYNWENHFSGIVISSTYGFRKPAGKFFHHLIEKCQTRSPSEILLIGDSLISDVLGALRCGLRAIHLRRADTANTESEYVTSITSLSELSSLLLNQNLLAQQDVTE